MLPIDCTVLILFSVEHAGSQAVKLKSESAHLPAGYAPLHLSCLSRTKYALGHGLLSPFQPDMQCSISGLHNARRTPYVRCSYHTRRAYVQVIIYAWLTLSCGVRRMAGFCDPGLLKYSMIPSLSDNVMRINSRHSKRLTHTPTYCPNGKPSDHSMVASMVTLFDDILQNVASASSGCLGSLSAQ